MYVCVYVCVCHEKQHYFIYYSWIKQRRVDSSYYYYYQKGGNETSSIELMDSFFLFDSCVAVKYSSHMMPNICNDEE